MFDILEQADDDREGVVVSPKAAWFVRQCRLEALGLFHNWVGTEHLLLAMTQNDETASVLPADIASTSKVEEAIEFVVGKGDSLSLPPMPSATPRLAKALRTAWQMAYERPQDQVLQPLHLLLGVIQQKDCIAVGILGAIGFNIANLEAQILVMLDQPVNARQT